MKKVILSIDIGTTGVKLSFVNLKGYVECSAYREYSIISESSAMAEEDPSAWWEGIVDGMKEIRERYGIDYSVEAISLCGQMHTHVYMDGDGRPLRRAITWLDQRSTSVISKWESSGIREKIFDITWVLPTTTYTLPQVCWVKENEPDVFEKTAGILVAKDYVKFILTGEKVTDPSDASGIGAFDIKSGRWSEEVFEMVEVRKNLFPDIASSTHVVGRVKASVAKELGLPEGVPVVNGGADHAVAEIGAGMLHRGDAVSVLGTAGVVAACSSEAIKDRRVVCWRYPIDGYWDILGITQTAASSLTWFRNAFDPDASAEIFEHYSELANEIDEGSNGLIFLPYLMGERTPHWDSDAKGVFFGVKMMHTKAHFIRAIMEGVAYSIKDCVEVMEQNLGDIGDIRLIGGGSKSDVWRKILSNVVGKRLLIPEVQDAGAIGNLILAGFSMGFLGDVRDAEALIRYQVELYPMVEKVKLYERLFNLYRQIYGATRDIMHEVP